MFSKVIRRAPGRRVTIRYKQAGETPTDGEAVADDRSASGGAPWHGQRVKIEDLPSFAARWGLVAVGGEWPAGEACPRLYMAETAEVLGGEPGGDGYDH